MQYTIDNEKNENSNAQVIFMDLRLIMNAEKVKDEPAVYQRTLLSTEEDELCDYCQDTSTWD